LGIGTELWQEFTTPPPFIKSITPPNGTQFVAPTASIQVEWNEPIDASSFFSHLHISPDLPKRELRKLNITWNYTVNPRVINIEMRPHFPENTWIFFSISPGVKSLATGRESTVEFTSSFFTFNPAVFYFRKRADIFWNQLLHLLSLPEEQKEPDSQNEPVPTKDSKRMSSEKLHENSYRQQGS